MNSIISAVKLGLTESKGPQSSADTADPSDGHDADWALDDLDDEDDDGCVGGVGGGAGGDDDSDDECLDNRLCTFVGTQKEFTNQHW